MENGTCVGKYARLDNYFFLYLLLISLKGIDYTKHNYNTTVWTCNKSTKKGRGTRDGVEQSFYILLENNLVLFWRRLL